MALFRSDVATHWLDYQLWPDRVKHLHSVLWYAGSVGLVCLLFHVRPPVLAVGWIVVCGRRSRTFALSWLPIRDLGLHGFL